MAGITDKWLHVQVLDDELYVFTDDGHWDRHPDWHRSTEVTWEELSKDCLIGGGDISIRIRLRPRQMITRYGKFGMPYQELEP